MKTLNRVIVAVLAGFLFVAYLIVGLAPQSELQPELQSLKIVVLLPIALSILGIVHYLRKTSLSPPKFSTHRIPLAVLHFLLFGGMFWVLIFFADSGGLLSLYKDFGVTGILMGILTLSWWVAPLIAGVGLLYEAHWAKVLARIIAFLFVVSGIPFVLMFGLYAWWVLTPSIKWSGTETERKATEQPA